MGGRQKLLSRFFPPRGYPPPPPPSRKIVLSKRAGIGFWAKKTVFYQIFSSANPPLNGKSFCQKSLAELGGTPPPPLPAEKICLVVFDGPLRMNAVLE